MTHPGLNSPRLADMRAVLDEVALSNNERHQIASALSEVESEREAQRREGYGHALGVRDDQHAAVMCASATCMAAARDIDFVSQSSTPSYMLTADAN